MRGWIKDVVGRSVPSSVLQTAREMTALLPPTLRFGKAYKDALALFLESENWDEADLIRYQENCLEQVIAHSYENVPFYRKLFDERGISPKDIQSLEDLRLLPIIDKETIRQSEEDFVAGNIPFFRRGLASTSGSTGAPFRFYMDDPTRAFERAVSHVHLLWLGYKPSDRIAYLNPRPVGNPERLLPRFSRRNEIRLTFRAMNEERLGETVRLLQEFKPDIISAWPSSLYLLARYMERRGTSVTSARFLVTSSENLYPHLREYLERAFDAPVADFYGQEEGVAVAMQCSYVKAYHVQKPLAIMELLPHSGDMYEIIGTSLRNWAMPFLRYRTGDLARIGTGECPCGRKFPTIDSIVGRLADFIITAEGKIVSPLLLNYCFHDLEDVRESQIIQEDRHTLRVLMVPWERVSSQTKELTTESLKNLLETDRMRIIVEEVGQLCETVGCKTPFVVSHVSRDEMLRGPS